MYLSFDEDRPEIPRVPAPISRSRGIELSLFGHVLIIAVLLFGPTLVPADRPQTPVSPLLKEPLRFVHMAPMVDRRETPLRPPEHSDLDRRSRTPVRPRDAERPTPFSRGNTPEKVVGAPEEKPAAAEPAAAAPPAATNPPSPEAVPRSATPPSSVPIPAVPATSAPPTSLGRSLRDLRQYLQRENLDNQRGGLVEDGPDIQFDSKGVEFGPWLRRFVEQVKRNWYVPQSAQFMTGRVVLQFYVEKNGAITELAVVAPSNVDAFNRSSFNAIKSSNPTLPLPLEYPLPRALFTVTFHYNERLDDR